MKLRSLVAIIVLMFPLALVAQRKATPVETDDKKVEKPRLHYYDKHGNLLDEPLEFITETDTVAKPSAAPKYPLLNSLSFGVNFFDAAMLAAGQKHASFDIWADLSFHNWFFPVVEAGVGFAKDTPEFGNFTYNGKPSFYAKVGLNYNFLYKSDPAYQAFLGIRAGFSAFSYDITDITVNSGYWGQSNNFSIMNQKASAFYGEVVAGVKVKIVKGFSLGWTGRFHFKMHTSAGSNSQPWFIPGYGTSSPVSFTFSAIYTIPFPHKDKTTDEAVAEQ